MVHDDPSRKRSSKKPKAAVSKPKVSKVIEESDKEEDDTDPYEKLELAQGQEQGGFKYSPEDKEYLLTNYFGLPAKIYERLFEH